VVCLAPRALEASVRPRRRAGVVARPLNFTVRRTLRGDKRREEVGDTASFDSAVNPRQLTRSSCRRLRLAQPACACGDGGFA
jgi:hypothetical protein